MRFGTNGVRNLQETSTLLLDSELERILCFIFCASYSLKYMDIV